METLFNFLLPSIRKYKVRFFFLTVLILSWSLENSFIPMVMGKMVDGLVKCKDKAQAWDAVGKTVVLYFSLWIFVHLCCRIGGFIQASLLPDFAADIRMRALKEVSRKSYDYFQGYLSGDISSKIYVLQEKVALLCSAFIYSIIPAVVCLIFASILFYSVKIEIACAVYFWLTLHMYVCIFMGKRCLKYEKIHSAANNILNGHIVDYIANHFTWRVFGNESYEYSHASIYQKKEIATAKKAQGYIAKLHTVLSALSILLNMCAINGISYYYWQNNEISIGDFVFIMNSVLGLDMLAWNIGLILPTMFADIGTCKQAFSVISEDSYIKDTVGAKDLSVGEGIINFDNVSFGYTEDLLFKNLSVQIKSCEKIGIVGRSGSGKTTFINLLLRLYDVNSGHILIDSQDISKVTQHSLRKSISLVPQDPVLFHRTILENIKYGNLAVTDAELKEAIRKANIEDILSNRSLDFDVGEGGRRLSKGQRQRIAIARAFLRDTKILLLDEVTSALDAVSEKAIQESLDMVMKNKTVIAIAHRLSTLQQMDRILVFDKGRIAEIGNHEELLKKRGIYYGLWQLQREGFIGGEED